MHIKTVCLALGNETIASDLEKCKLVCKKHCFELHRWFDSRGYSGSVYSL